jgi:hypothetical protein
MGSALWFGVALLVAATSVSIDATRLRVGQGPSARIVGTRNGQPLSATVPFPSGVTFETAIEQLTSSVHAPTGFEIVQRDPSIRAPDVDGPRMVTLSGKPVAELLDLFVYEAPRVAAGTPHEAPMFSWNDTGLVIHVTQFASQPTALDTMVPSFTLTQASLRDALVAVHRIFDPGRPTPRGEAGSIGYRPPVDSVLPSVPGEARAATRPPIDNVSEPDGDWDAMFNDANISVALRNVSARSVLDEIVLRSGKGSWVVRYRDQTASYRGCQLAFTLFDSRVRTELEARQR